MALAHAAGACCCLLPPAPLPQAIKYRAIKREVAMMMFFMKKR